MCHFHRIIITGIIDKKFNSKCGNSKPQNPHAVAKAEVMFFGNILEYLELVVCVHVLPYDSKSAAELNKTPLSK